MSNKYHRHTACLRCQGLGKACDRQQPCGRCRDAAGSGVAIEACTRAEPGAPKAKQKFPRAAACRKCKEVRHKCSFESLPEHDDVCTNWVMADNGTFKRKTEYELLRASDPTPFEEISGRRPVWQKARDEPYTLYGGKRTRVSCNECRRKQKKCSGPGVHDGVCYECFVKGLKNCSLKRTRRQDKARAQSAFGTVSTIPRSSGQDEFWVQSLPHAEDNPVDTQSVEQSASASTSPSSEILSKNNIAATTSQSIISAMRMSDGHEVASTGSGLVDANSTTESSRSGQGSESPSQIQLLHLDHESSQTSSMDDIASGSLGFDSLSIGNHFNEYPTHVHADQFFPSPPQTGFMPPDFDFVQPSSDACGYAGISLPPAADASMTGFPSAPAVGTSNWGNASATALDTSVSTDIPSPVDSVMADPVDISPLNENVSAVPEHDFSLSIDQHSWDQSSFTDANSVSFSANQHPTLMPPPGQSLTPADSIMASTVDTPFVNGNLSAIPRWDSGPFNIQPGWKPALQTTDSQSLAPMAYSTSSHPPGWQPAVYSTNSHPFVPNAELMLSQPPGLVFQPPDLAAGVPEFPNWSSVDSAPLPQFADLQISPEREHPAGVEPMMQVSFLLPANTEGN